MAADSLKALVQRTRLSAIVVVEQHLMRGDWASPNLEESRLTPVEWAAPVVEVFSPETLPPGRLLHVVRAQIQNEGEAVYQLTVAARVTYEVAGAEAAPELLAKFAAQLPRHHAWPVLRERLLSLALMSALQPPLLDLHQQPRF